MPLVGAFYARLSAEIISLVGKLFRRREDLNPREPYDSSGFRNRCTQPLCDASLMCFILSRKVAICNDEFKRFFLKLW